MDPLRTIKLSWGFSSPADISYQLARFRFPQSIPTWQPAVNVYRCDKSVRVCVDLAGVERADIDLRVEPEQLIIRGTRDVPEPEGFSGQSLQMLIMEIDYGPFERVIRLSQRIDVEKAHAEQRNGLLWIHLPFES